MNEKTVYLVVFISENNKSDFNIYKITDKNNLEESLSEFINNQLEKESLLVVDNLQNLGDISSAHKHFNPGILVKLTIDESFLSNPVSEKDLAPNQLNASRKPNRSIKQNTKINKDSITFIRPLKNDEYKNTQTFIFFQAKSKFQEYWNNKLAVEKKKISECSG